MRTSERGGRAGHEGRASAQAAGRTHPAAAAQPWHTPRERPRTRGAHVLTLCNHVQAAKVKGAHRGSGSSPRPKWQGASAAVPTLVSHRLLQEQCRSKAAVHVCMAWAHIYICMDLL